MITPDYQELAIKLSHLFTNLSSLEEEAKNGFHTIHLNRSNEIRAYVDLKLLPNSVANLLVTGLIKDVKNEIKETLKQLEAFEK